MGEHRGRRLATTAALLALVATAAPAAAAPNLKRYPTRYYEIYTDLEEKDDIREAAVRMTAMAEEYMRRTRSFTGRIRSKQPFYLFTKREDYQAAGGPAGSAGVYQGRGDSGRLMAVAGSRTNPWTWKVIQHEGFHQFVHHVIGGRMPAWTNEGLAEYFGEALFIGDGYVAGLIPPYRLTQLQSLMKSGKTNSLAEMMRITQAEWNQHISGANYLMVWSMVHFLVHAEKGKYRDAFAGFIRDIARGGNAKTSWKKRLGSDVDAFEEKWKAWWLARKPDATEGLYAKAVVATLTGYYARAVSQGQKFADATDFIAAASKNELKADKNDWLPASLLKVNLRLARALGDWSLEDAGKPTARLVCRWKDGIWVGGFKLKGSRVDKVAVAARELGPPTSQPDEEEWE